MRRWIGRFYWRASWFAWELRAHAFRCGQQPVPGPPEYAIIQSRLDVRKVGGQLHHVKLHGALYHLSDADEGIAGSYLSYLRENWPDLVIYARSNGLVHEMAETIGLEVWPEGFLDRAYNDDGTLVSRTHPNAILSRDLFLLRLDQVAAQQPIQGTTAGL